MARYKPVDRNPRLLPVALSEQIQPGSFEVALDHLVGYEPDLSGLDAHFNNDEVGASAYDPRVMLAAVLPGAQHREACASGLLLRGMAGQGLASRVANGKMTCRTSQNQSGGSECGDSTHPSSTRTFLLAARGFLHSLVMCH